MTGRLLSFMTEPARKKPPADNETSSAAIATRQEQYQRQPHKSPAFSFRKEPLQRERERKYGSGEYPGPYFFCQCLRPNRDRTRLACEHNVTPPRFLRVTRELVKTGRDGEAGRPNTEVRNPIAYSTPQTGVATVEATPFFGFHALPQDNSRPRAP